MYSIPGCSLARAALCAPSHSGNLWLSPHVQIEIAFPGGMSFASIFSGVSAVSRMSRAMPEGSK